MRFLSFCLVFLFSISALADDSRAYRTKLNKLLDQPVSEPFLYKVTKEGSSNAVYLFGTVHFGYGTESLPYWVMDIFYQASIHGYEFDLTEGVIPYYNSLQDLHIQTRLNAENQAVLSFWRAQNDLSDQQIEHIQSLGFSRAQALLITSVDCLLFGFTDIYFERPHRSFDYEMLINSQLLGKRLLFLEDEKIREEANKLSDEPLDNTCDLSEDATKDNLELTRKELSFVFEAYLSGDEDKLSALGDSDDPGTTYRNQQWMLKIENVIIGDQDVFLTFGAFHLFGEQGLLKLLKARSYKVERVSSPRSAIFKR